MKHFFIYFTAFLLFSVPVFGMEGDSQKTAHLLLYGHESGTGQSAHSTQKPVPAKPATMWERFCIGQHYVYLGGVSLYAARHFLNKPAIVSKAFGGGLFFCGAALVGLVFYPFSFWQKPVEDFRKKLSQHKP